MTLIHGIPVELASLSQVGVDPFGVPVMQETWETVQNVIVSPISGTEAAQIYELYGKDCTYQMCIPKGDTHEWEDTAVQFYGRRWRTVGPVLEYIDDLVPLAWNKKVTVRRDEQADLL